MLKTKRRTLIIILAIFVAVCTTIAVIGANGSGLDAVYAATGIISFEDGKATLTTGENDPFDEEKTGLKISATGKNVRADVNEIFEGNSTIDLKAVGEAQTLPSLQAFSIVYTEIYTGQSFAVKVRYSIANLSAYDTPAADRLVTEVFVEYNEAAAGIYYNPSNNIPNGYTSGNNSLGQYTRFYDGKSAVISFDAAKPKISVADSSARWYKDLTVWDFSNDVNDGKYFGNDLSSFEKYKISIVFDDISGNESGDLIVYSIADKNGTLDFSAIDDGYLNLAADFENKAVVGVPYVLPKAEVIAFNKETAENGEISAKVFDINDNEITIENGAFVPVAVGNYRVIYTYSVNGEEKLSKAFVLEAVESEIVEFVYEREMKALTTGLNGVVYLPKATVKNNTSLNSKISFCRVVILKNGEIVEEVGNGGVAYRFAELGEYEVSYTDDKSQKTETFKITVTEAEEGIVCDVPEENIELGTNLTVSPAKIYFGGDEIISEVKVIYPSGKAENGESCLLDELGKYTVVYTYTIGESEKSFEEEFTVKSGLEASFTLENASVSYGRSKHNSLLTGALFTVKSGAKITYNKVIDLSNSRFDDGDTVENKLNQTKYVPIIDIMSDPAKSGAVDLTTIFITLTDVQDESNEMSVRVRYPGDGSGSSKIRAKGKGQPYTGRRFVWNSSYTDIDYYVVDNNQSHEFGGFSSSHSFTQKFSGLNSYENTCRIYYDAEENALYGRPIMTTKDNVDWLICDFDDENFFNSPWTGFRTGEVKLSVTFAGIESYSDILIRSVYGEKFDGNLLNDDIKPEISFDFDAAPVGQRNKPYRVPEFSAADNSGIIVNKFYNVYYGGEEVHVADGAFVPNKTGSYVIRYGATDSFGNTATKDVTVNVKNYVPRPEITFAGEIPESAKFGERITLPEIITDGGAGGIKVSVVVTVNEKVIPVTNGKFDCSAAGTYTIVVKAVDHIGNETTSVAFMNVEFGGEPVFDESNIVLPAAFIGGESFTFPSIYADYYGNETASAEKIAAKITVDENGNVIEIGEDGVYTPKTGEAFTEAKIAFRFEKNGKVSVAERTIPIKQIREAAKFMESFFVTENAEISSSSSEILVTATEGASEASAEFIRKAAVKNLSVTVKPQTKNFGRFIITLRDSADASAVIRLVYTNIGQDRAELSVNDEKKVTTYLDGGKIGLNFAVSNAEITDAKGAYNATVTKNYDGTEFKGFGSGFVYISYKAEEIYGETSFGITQINRQNFNYLAADSVRPDLTVNGTLSGKVSVKTTVRTPSASAYDVLFGISSLKLTVIDPSEKEVFSASADKEYDVTLGKFGTYQFVYEAKDASRKKNTITVTKTITVFDDSAPELEFESEFIKEITVGYMYELPKYIVKDNTKASACNVTVSVITPRGLSEVVKDGTVKFFYKGTYTINYLVTDEDGNCALYTFKIVSKEAE